MKIFKTLVALLISTLLLSCHKEDQLLLSDDDYLIFGQFYGECNQSLCFLMYKLTDDTLYINAIEDSFSFEHFNFVKLNNSQFNLAKNLPDYFPNQLLSEENAIIGCPDCYDQGGIFIQLSKNGDLKSWRIDNDKKNIPSYLHTFVDKVHEKIDLLNP